MTTPKTGHTAKAVGNSFLQEADKFIEQGTPDNPVKDFLGSAGNKADLGTLIDALQSSTGDVEFSTLGLQAALDQIPGLTAKNKTLIITEAEKAKGRISDARLSAAQGKEIKALMERRNAEEDDDEGPLTAEENYVNVIRKATSNFQTIAKQPLA